MFKKPRRDDDAEEDGYDYVREDELETFDNH
jgi:hypothetical protein